MVNCDDNDGDDDDEALEEAVKKISHIGLRKCTSYKYHCACS